MSKPIAANESPDPAACPECGGRMKVLKTRRQAGGIVTRYRACKCGTHTLDQSREVAVPYGKPRVIRVGKKSVQIGHSSAESAPAVVPTSEASR